MSAMERFLRRVSPEPNTGCWLWTGYTQNNGYGTFNIERDGLRKTVYVHRFSIESSGRKIPAGMVVDHLCRVRSCVNPDHLEVVTPQENVLRGQHKNVRAHLLGKCLRCSTSLTRRGDGRQQCLRCRAAKEKKVRDRKKLSTERAKRGAK